MARGGAAAMFAVGGFGVGGGFPPSGGGGACWIRLVPELLLVGSALVVGFLQVAGVVLAELGLTLVPKKVAWN
jgi:hypothetical protein